MTVAIVTDKNINTPHIQLQSNSLEQADIMSTKSLDTDVEVLLQAEVSS